MKKLDASKPTPTDGLNLSGVLAEIRLIKNAINDAFDDLAEIRKAMRTRK